MNTELRNASDELQIWEALAVASNDVHGMLDAVMRASEPDAANRALQHRYGFTRVQALAVLDMQVRRVTAIDRETTEERRQELTSRVQALQANLTGPDAAAGVPAFSRPVRGIERSLAR